MGIYAVTGGSSGIGAKTVEYLRAQGHLVYNIDINGGDITANLASEEGRTHVIERLHALCTEGMDGMICCAGVSNNCGNLKLIVSLNYFGAVRLVEGVFDLLAKRKGACVVVASNTISQGAARMDVVDLLNNQMDEERVLRLMDRLDVKREAHAMYVATKYAVARWMRRVSAHWAANGVRINAIAPGNVETAMTAKLSPQERVAVMALPIPTLYGEEKLMDPSDIASSIVFLVSQQAHGLNGIVLFCDGGTDALLNSEKVY
ncbi:MAG: SDR family oxidoreductase [Oscillospiraceae bacterium]|nr:SDR family oxidoreductase [Oscillospiraceae bacterium]